MPSNDSLNTAANSVNPDPFVLQTYKSTMCFLTSFIVLALGVEYKFSPYGIISGLLWVSGGACGIFGIRNSGLAISVGTWSAITVLVSFAWGILVFGETVKSVWMTAAGVGMMIIGFIGMAYFSSPQVVSEQNDDTNNVGDDDNDDDGVENIAQRQEQLENEQGHLIIGDNNDTQNGLNDGSNANSLKEPLLQNYAMDEERQQIQVDKIEVESSDHTSPSTTDDEDEFQNNPNHIDDKTTILFLGMKWNRRRLGLLGAAMDGFLGGMMLVPMHFSAYHGEEYIISFGTGAMAVTLFFWLVRFSYNSYEEKSVKKGWEKLPSLHFKTLIIPGGLAGLIWSIGNIGLIFSVSFLGESIGMSIVQSNMIVSGMIGIVWYQEIKGLKHISLWSLSAILTFIGIVFLSYQHKSS